MSNRLALLCVWRGVKVGYSLLLGHVSNPLTLAWILLPDAFSSNTHALLPDGRGLWDSATGVKVHEQPGEAFKQPPIPPFSRASLHPTDVFFFGLSPNCVLLTTISISVISAATPGRLRLKRFEVR